MLANDVRHRPRSRRKIGKVHWWGNGRWAIPMSSGLLIVASFVVAKVFGSDGVGNIFMVAAALVAGTPILITAARGLTSRVVGIDLLVSVAVIGALIIGQYWEAAAVSFLFGIGHALEAAGVVMGETVLVKNGAKVPVDGEVIAGTGALDEASITGESIPVEKSTGDQGAYPRPRRCPAHLRAAHPDATPPRGETP